MHRQHTSNRSAPSARADAPGLNRTMPPAPRPVLAAATPAAQGFQPTTLAWILATAFAVLAHTAHAQPSGAQVVAGQATLQQQGNNLLVTTQNAPGSQHSTINWQSFSVPAGSTAWFNQPSASSTSINRVVGTNPSQIFGTLGSNGHLVLVNPAGIAVGAGAVVDTARFTAAAMHMSDADALSARLRFEGGTQVQVHGQVLARGSDVLMLAPDVQVAPGALVQAPNGAVLLAAGQKVEVMAPGLDGLRFEIQAPTDQAVNLGELRGSAVGMFASQLRHSGQMNVEAVQAGGGKIVIRAKDQATIDGTARTQGLDGLGGQFHATAQSVLLTGQARIDASGHAGGGEVLIGGGWQGRDARLPNAQSTVVERGATIDASATGEGHGGTVVAWADGATTFQGQISARGGDQGGDGGRVETSGQHSLTLGGQVDTRAPRGQTGQWLLDPISITLQGGAAPPAPEADTLYESDLETATSNIHIQAEERIAVAGSFTEGTIRLPGVSITLETTGTSPGGISLVVPNAVPTPIALETGGTGTITLQTGANQNIQTGHLATSGGDISVRAGGQLELNHAVVESNGGDITLQGGSTGFYAGSGVYIHNDSRIDAATGTLTISGTSYTDAGVKISNSEAASSAPLVIKGNTITVNGRTEMGGSGLHLE
ncbi:MAG: filamentous hemagglutinin N-terminal domain-containing protein, partial [Hydrogenophaga sp.]|nr:filamentous hemagglutinin N-terminal domain-containing protein [Hydrogenophaga sp.]